jgi:glycosyltransferase involved in cell wall biosynthesis
MRIVFIAESFPTSAKVDVTGGVETRDWYVAYYLAKQHQVTVVTTARAGFPNREKIRGIEVIRVGNAVESSKRETVFTRLSFVLGCVTTVSDLEFDLIQGSNVVTQAIAAFIGQQMHKPIVALIPDIFIGVWIKNTGLITGLIGEILEPWVLKQPWDAVISWSSSTTQKLLDKKISADRISTIPGGVDVTFINEKQIAKRKLPTVITAARLVSYKRLDALIDAIALLSKKYPQISLNIMGDGPEKDSLKRRAIAKNIDNRVQFMGQVSSYATVIKTMKSAHIFSLPSEVEGFGLATLEACACGLPYVNVDIPATHEVTKNGKGGILVPHADSQAIAEALDELLKNKKLYNTKVREAVQLARIYDWSVCVKKTEKIFKKITNQSATSSVRH